MRVGLRVDVDTFRGTRLGVPRLCGLLRRLGIEASFFFSVGPDNMGRHIWRLLRPAFLRKMVRTRAPSLYGPGIFLRGTFWPGPRIGTRLSEMIRDAAGAGHEIGLHAWDHHAWQTRLEAMDREAVRRHLDRGVSVLAGILGRPPSCSAAPAWRCNDLALAVKESFAFEYNSDCRGESVFRPLVNGVELSQPQVPTTLPTYDEVVGLGGVTDETYNDHMLSLMRPERLNVLTVHAEVEGIARLPLFERFLAKACAAGIEFCTLGAELAACGHIGSAPVERSTIPGRDGWVACQGAGRSA